MLQKFVAFIIITILINACCGSKEELKDSTYNYKKIAETKFGDDHQFIFNIDSTYLVVYHLNKSNKKNVFPPLKFFVYSLDEEKIIYEENLPNGKVEWINDHQIRVSTIPGIVSGEEEKNKRLFGFIYDVNLRRKIYGEIKTKKQ